MIPTGKYYKSKYGDIYYEFSGADGNPVVIFTHGVGMDHITFRLQVEALKTNYKTLVWDLPGHGHSSLGNYNKRFTEMSAECLNDLMEELKIKEAVFVGQSLGSITVQYFQIKFPHKVIATVHVPGIELKSHVGAWSKKFLPFMMSMLKLIPAKTFYKSFGEHRAVKKEVQIYLSDTMKRTGKKLALEITEDMAYDLIDESPEITPSPLLITYGNKDLFFIRKAARKWHKNIPNSKCMEIPDANHIANQDNPEVFNSILIDFLETVKS